MLRWILRSQEYNSHVEPRTNSGNLSVMQRIIFSWSYIAAILTASHGPAVAQQPPYDVFPPADPPYHRARYEASQQPSELPFAVNYTIWIPKGVGKLRGV